MLAGVGGGHRLPDPFDRVGRVDAGMQRTGRHQVCQLAVQRALGVIARVAEPLRPPEAPQRDVAKVAQYRDRRPRLTSTWTNSILNC